MLLHKNAVVSHFASLGITAIEIAISEGNLASCRAFSSCCDARGISMRHDGDAEAMEDGEVRSERIFVIDCRGATRYNLTVLSHRHATNYEMGLENGKR